MLDKSFGLLFYLKKPRNYVKGDVPIYLRITVDGTPKELSVKRSCDPARWNPSAGRASGTKENVKALNSYLDTYQARVFEAKRKLVEDHQLVTATAIKDVLMGADQRGKMIIKIFEDYNADEKC
ncbi:MAG: Arm DNA-binding domain-containing protein [Chitinophagaceae bacterium]|nr:Arm DNA-binding domain-containing protein [Chitinophagaceae bacterium]